jgi:hypothetical protein
MADRLACGKALVDLSLGIGVRSIYVWNFKSWLALYIIAISAVKSTMWYLFEH